MGPWDQAVAVFVPDCCLQRYDLRRDELRSVFNRIFHSKVYYKNRVGFSKCGIMHILPISVLESGVLTFSTSLFNWHITLRQWTFVSDCCEVEFHLFNNTLYDHYSLEQKFISLNTNFLWSIILFSKAPVPFKSCMDLARNPSPSQLRYMQLQRRIITHDNQDRLQTLICRLQLFLDLVSSLHFILLRIMLLIF